MAISRLDLSVLLIILFISIYHFFGKKFLAPKKYSQLPLHEVDEKYSNCRQIADIVRDCDKNAIIFFGSQTGTAEDFASRIGKEAHAKYGLNVLVADLQDYDYDTLDQLKEDVICFFILATYGEGEPTDNAEKFYSFIIDPDVEFSQGLGDKPLENLNYTMFGLGNKTYQEYNQMAINVQKRLNELGASILGQMGLGDDDSGNLEDDFMAWKESIWSVLKSKYKLVEKEANYLPNIKLKELPLNQLTSTPSQLKNVFLGEWNKSQLVHTEEIESYGPHLPFAASITSSKQIYIDSSRICLHMELDFGDSNLLYETGDHLAIWPVNQEDEVSNLIDLLKLQDKKDQVIDLQSIDSYSKISIPHPTTYLTILRYYLNICGPVSRDLLVSLSQFANDTQTRTSLKLYGQDKDHYHSEISSQFKTLSQILRQFSDDWSAIPFTFLIENIAHLQPRFYSISSSPRISGSKKATVTAVIENFHNPVRNIRFNGLTTNYLLAVHNKISSNNQQAFDKTYIVDGPRNSWKSQDPKIYMFIRHSHFKLPDSEAPIIMVGCGTGIAPFRGFVQERIQTFLEEGDIGHTVLFFGCRKSSEDFIFQDVWSEAQNVLKDKFSLYCAFSREDKDKKNYVQHRMLEPAIFEQIGHLLTKNHAYFYICGDAARMAVDVNTTLVTILDKFAPNNDGNAYVRKLRSTGRYLEDIWS